MKWTSQQVRTSSIDIYSRTYKSPSKGRLTRHQIDLVKGRLYSNVEQLWESIHDCIFFNHWLIVRLLMIVIPLGSYGSVQNSWFDSISTANLDILWCALPTIALVCVRLAGSFFGLPDSFPVLGAQDWRSYVLLISDSWVVGIHYLVVRVWSMSLTCGFQCQFARSKVVRTWDLRKHASKMRWFHWYLVLGVLLLESLGVHLLKQSSLSQVWVKCWLTLLNIKQHHGHRTCLHLHITCYLCCHVRWYLDDDAWSAD